MIFGYYGHGNIGDEANLRLLIRELRQIEPALPITVISANPAQTAFRHRVQACGRLELWSWLAPFRRSEWLIGGGGSLFQDHSSLRSLLYYAGLTVLAKICGMKVLLYGQGIGPFETRIGKKLAGLALNRADLIVLRDRLSLAALSALGVTRPELHWTAEPLLVTEPVPKPQIIHYWEPYSADRRFRIGVAIRRDRAASFQDWAGLVQLLKSQNDVSVYLLITEPADLQLAEIVAVATETVLLPPAEEWEELQTAVGGLDLLVSARLHGLVAAAVQGVPGFGLSCDPKIEGFCLQMNLPFRRIRSAADWDIMPQRILGKLYHSDEKGSPGLGPEVSCWRARAAENRMLLEKVIESKRDAYPYTGHSG